jgi:hypothetical protein
MDDVAIAGYYRMETRQVDEAVVGADLNGDGDWNDTVARTVMLSRRNPAGQDLQEQLHPY